MEHFRFLLFGSTGVILARSGAVKALLNAPSDSSYKWILYTVKFLEKADKKS